MFIFKFKGNFADFSLFWTNCSPNIATKKYRKDVENIKNVILQTKNDFNYSDLLGLDHKHYDKS